MSKIYLTLYSVDEVQYFIDYFTTNIAAYNLDELTNGMSGDIPSITNMHALSQEYGNLLSSGSSNYTSLMPAIGIELINDVPAARQVIGKGFQTVEIDQDFIDDLNSASLENRYKNGKLISDTNIASMQTALDTAIGNSTKLYGTLDRDLQNQTINISIWSADMTVTRYIYLVVRSLLHRIEQDAIAVGLKNMSITGTNGLYNYDFDKTLYGAEFNVTFLQELNSITVDTDISEITDVELVTKTGILGNTAKAGVTGKGIGG